MSEQKNLELPIVRHIYQNFALDSLRWNFFRSGRPIARPFP